MSDADTGMEELRGGRLMIREDFTGSQNLTDLEAWLARGEDISSEKIGKIEKCSRDNNDAGGVGAEDGVQREIGKTHRGQ